MLWFNFLLVHFDNVSLFQMKNFFFLCDSNVAAMENLQYHLQITWNICRKGIMFRVLLWFKRCRKVDPNVHILSTRFSRGKVYELSIQIFQHVSERVDKFFQCIWLPSVYGQVQYHPCIREISALERSPIRFIESRILAFPFQKRQFYTTAPYIHKQRKRKWNIKITHTKNTVKPFGNK